MITQDNGEYYTALSHVYAAAKAPEDLVMKQAEEMAKSLNMRILTGATLRPLMLKIRMSLLIIKKKSASMIWFWQ